MTVKIYSRKTVEELFNTGFSKNTAVISFYDPELIDYDEEYKPVDYAGKADYVFQLPLYDIDIDELDEYDLTYDTYFPEVTKIAEFIFNAKAKGMDIICQCEHGQSRSAACAAAILEYFCKNGISVFADYKYHPNKMVFNKVLDALQNFRR